VKDSFYLTRQILRLRLERNPDSGEEEALVHSCLSDGGLFVVADPATSESEWAGKSFGIAVQDKALRLFIEKEDALRYAGEIGSQLKDGTPMVLKATQAMVNSLIGSYARKSFITGVWLCGKAPVRALVGVECFDKGVKRDKASTITDPDAAVGEEPALGDPSAPNPNVEEPPEKLSVENNEELKLVDEVRKVLSEPSKAERKKIDPSGSYLNLPYLIEKLLFANLIDPGEMDGLLGLNKGFTKNFISDKISDTIPMEIAERYLRYFGLQEFLYLFAANCKELREMLANHPQLDKYKPKAAKGPEAGKEVFELTNIEQTKTNKGFNVFRLTFKSPDRAKPVRVISSTNIDMNIGWRYTLEGLEPARSLSTIAPMTGAATATASGPSQAEMEAALEKSKEKAKAESDKKQGKTAPQQAQEGKSRYYDVTPEQKIENDRQTVLGWIIKHKKVSPKEAMAEMAKFESDTEVLDAFAKYCVKEDKAASKFGRRGYTPARLMRKLNFTPVEAFTILADLRSKPQETLQMLKYRETDPQYQKQKPATEEKK